MKIQTECVPCLLKRMLFETELSTKDQKKQTKALRAACALLGQLYDPKVCSATIATQVHRAVYEALGDRDPYTVLKQQSNLVAKSLVPKVEALLEQSEDRLRTSMVCSIIGNIMDFGIDGSSAHPGMLQEVFDALFEEGLGHDEYPRLKELIADASQVVVCTDNCGEIVFDKILCRELKTFNPGLRLTVVVKGEPILSDATLQDASEVHLGDVVDEVVTTGCFAVGVDVAKLPRKVRDALEDADVILAKGMANYESFSETDLKPIAYLLRTKCSAIARSMGLPRDISVIQVQE
jgi:damage-control phosphatase, subfamily I